MGSSTTQRSHRRGDDDAPPGPGIKGPPDAPGERKAPVRRAPDAPSERKAPMRRAPDAPSEKKPPVSASPPRGGGAVS